MQDQYIRNITIYLKKNQRAQQTIYQHYYSKETHIHLYSEIYYLNSFHSVIFIRMNDLSVIWLNH